MYHSTLTQLILLWVFLFCSAFIFSCQKEEVRIDEISVKKNGIDWEQDKKIPFVEYDTSRNSSKLILAMRNSDETFPYAERLYFYNLNLTLEKQFVSSQPCDLHEENDSLLYAQYDIFDYDVFINCHEVLAFEEMENWIQLTQITEEGFKGNFNLVLQQGYGGSEILRFTDGMFEVTY